MERPKRGTFAIADLAPSPSLRQRQKNRRCARIIAAGKKLFSDQGYSTTNMEAIAELAEVGVATVYNYFGSKGGLLANILRPELEELIAQGRLLLDNPPDDPVAGMLSLIDIYRRFQNSWDRKDALRAAIGPGLSAEPVLDVLSAHAENRVKEQISALITHYQTQRKIRPAIDVTDAATIIFFIFNQHFIEYITRDEADYTQMKMEMDRQISFIVSASSVSGMT
ncbi:MAG: TetR/AcrR family transcriptional regulator [Alphaproteobacteria bacterium]|nr:TetR/AcrR family transcriptional regulator [Alphaproteobacteria bacterium]